jgi:hypothetical protein
MNFTGLTSQNQLQCQPNYDSLDPRYDAGPEVLAIIAANLEHSQKPGNLCRLANIYLEQSAAQAFRNTSKASLWRPRQERPA